jgi:hypothetical protein
MADRHHSTRYVPSPRPTQRPLRAHADPALPFLQVARQALLRAATRTLRPLLTRQLHGLLETLTRAEALLPEQPPSRPQPQAQLTSLSPWSR